MRFDASRAESYFRELCETRYLGPGAEARVADLVASRFEAMGLLVERREAAGSRFPQRVASRIGWTGYGLLVTSVYGVILPGGGLSLVVAWVLAALCGMWLTAVLFKWIHPGRHRPPFETAPVVMASLPGRTAAPFRVVFQSVITRLEVDPFPFRLEGRIEKLVLSVFLCTFPGLWAATVLVCRLGLLLDPGRRALSLVADVLIRYVYPAFLAMVWIGILTLRRYRRDSAEPDQPDRRGLALLLETAGSWPRTGSRSIEPVFVAAGGQRLDAAGSREILRLLKSKWSSTPTLLILFFEPGSGDELRLSTCDPLDRGLNKLAEDAARSLWIPHRRDSGYALLTHWPLEHARPAVALIGSDPSASDDSIEPQALHRAGQLAMEIALRWAKTQKAAGNPESAG